MYDATPNKNDGVFSKDKKSPIFCLYSLRSRQGVIEAARFQSIMSIQERLMIILIAGA